MTTPVIQFNVASVTESIGAAPLAYSVSKVDGRKKSDMKPINVAGVAYVPQIALEEALDIVAGYSELYDGLASSPSEPTAQETKAESALCRRWVKLRNKVYPVRKAR